MFESILDEVTVADLQSLRSVTPLSDQAAESLARIKAVGQALDLLAKQNLLPDAVQLLAHALPPRKAIWWACQCTREIDLNSQPLVAAERWAIQPTEDHRRACQAAYESAGLQTPGAVVALAVFLSGKSLAPPGLPEVPPDPFHAAKAVAGALLMASVIKQPEQSEDKLRHFLSIGDSVASGKDRWAETAAASETKQPSSATGPVPQTPPKPSSPRKLDSWE